jgi:hypothetical protein
LPIDYWLDVLPVSVRRHMFRGEKSNQHARGPLESRRYREIIIRGVKCSYVEQPQ